MSDEKYGSELRVPSSEFRVPSPRPRVIVETEDISLSSTASKNREVIFSQFLSIIIPIRAGFVTKKTGILN